MRNSPKVGKSSQRGESVEVQVLEKDQADVERSHQRSERYRDFSKFRLASTGAPLER
jgi:hypothetical protein